MVSVHWWYVIAVVGGFLAGLAFVGLHIAIEYVCQLDDEWDQPDDERGDHLAK